MISDRHLKRDIRLLAVMSDGMKIYAFKYLWSEATQVGVMAQDLLENPYWRGAVIAKANGFYSVDYARLGLRMATLEEWNRQGMDSILPKIPHPA